jgi:hypothetical protein
MRALLFGAIAVLTVLVPASHVTAQISVPVKSYETLTVQIQSFRDDITLYRGDPQELMYMDVRPNRFRPRVEYLDADGSLRIRDQYAIDNPNFRDQTPEERDKSGKTPYEENWEIRLSPTAPTAFSLFCERGESEFDFTDMEVQRVELRTEETDLKVDFSKLNPIVLERFAARVIAGSLEFKNLINAHAKEITLDVPGAACQIALTGKQFDGESAINVLGVPTEMRLRVSRKVGVRVTGPASTIARFQAPHMSQSGEDLLSQGYAEAKCRIHLTFGSEIPNLGVSWD